MKRSKALIKTQRKSLDEKLSVFQDAKSLLNPRNGWVKAIRESLGMTTSQLAERIGIQQSGVTYLEQREAAQTVSLESLDRAAKAMNCRLIYALVPESSLEEIVEKQARKAATEILKNTLHSMELEQQVAGSAETNLHLEELTQEIKAKMDSRLWGKK